MTFEPTVGDGAQALDIGTLYKLVRGNGVLSGLDVTINSGDLDAADTLSVASGTALVDGTEHSVSATTVGITSATDNPRKDVIYVDGTGAVDVAEGQEAEPLPVDDETGQHAIREHAYAPSPPDLSGMAAVPVYEIWVDASSTTLESADVYLDRRPPGRIPTAILEAIGVGDLDFDPATQTELDSHAGSADAHHARDHASRHHDGGADAVNVEDLSTAGSDGEVPTVQSDGTLAMQSGSDGGVDKDEFTADGTWNKPSGVSMVAVQMWGAGGGGGASQDTGFNGGGGGGGGEYVFRVMDAADVGSSVSVVVGAGGAGASAGGETGGDGGDSQFGDLLARGGVGGGVGGSGGNGGGIGISHLGGGKGDTTAAEYGGGGGGGSEDGGGDSVYAAGGGGGGGIDGGAGGDGGGTGTFSTGGANNADGGAGADGGAFAGGEGGAGGGPNSSYAGGDGGSPGGGGGGTGGNGSSGAGLGGNGADGLVIVYAW